jgi:hypothetical protein
MKTARFFVSIVPQQHLFDVDLIRNQAEVNSLTGVRIPPSPPKPA